MVLLRMHLGRVLHKRRIEAGGTLHAEASTLLPRSGSPDLAVPDPVHQE